MTEISPYDWKFYLAERLHIAFDFYAKEIGILYHPKWIDDESFRIVDDQENLCVNPSIYRVLKSLQEQYSFSIDENLTIHKI